MKSLKKAKQRLAPLLPPAERQALVRAMLADVLVACMQWTTAHETVLATIDPEIISAGEDAGATACRDDAALGMDEAVQAAARCARTEHLLILPGDIPCVTPADLDAMLAGTRGGALAVAPAASGGGTNALAMTTRGAIRTRFGDQSFRCHLDAARAAGLAVSIVRRAGLGLDIDTPDDLAACVNADAGRHTAACLRRLAAGPLPGRACAH